MSSMFGNYNKNNAKGTLVGNWVEEEALRSATGFSRRKVPEARGPHSPAKDAGTRKDESTHNRVLLHAKENGMTTYETTVQASTNYGEGNIKPAIGPRTSQREAQILEAARRLHESELATKRDAQHRETAAARSVSMTTSSFVAPETSVLMASTRVPRGRNGSRVIDTSVAHLTRAQVDSLDQAKLDVLMQQQQQDVPVTRYSYALATGVGLDFGSSSSDSHNPFARSSTFTNDIHDPSKRHGEAMEPASAHDEPVGMTVHQRSALKRLLHGVKQHTALWSQLKNELAKSVDDNAGVLHVADFRSAFTVVQCDWLSEREVIHVFMYFDVDHIGAIHLDDLLSFCSSQSL